MVKFNDRIIGEDNPPYFIADIGANHDGDLNRALKLIELAKIAGADAAKFQNFIADKIINAKEFEKNNLKISHQSSWKKSVFEIYRDASINLNWTNILKNKCDEVGIEYLTTPYDEKSLDAVDDFLHFYKIGSGDISWTDFLISVAKKDKPVIISSGASSLEDVERALNTVKKHNTRIVLLQCNTNYTASIENFKYVNLNVLKLYKEKFPEVILGLSDHTFGSTTVLGAIALGAKVIEKHFTDDNNRLGPDHKFAMNPESFRSMVNESKLLWQALGDGKKRIEPNELESSIIQRRSLYSTKNIKKGSKITINDLIALRPMQKDGFQPFELDSILNKTLNRDIELGDPIKKRDFKNE